MSSNLTKYRHTRDFRITPEPSSERPRLGKSLRFVVQKHAARSLHYDFRLELDGVLKSWAVPKGPSLDPAVKRLAVHVEDHPLAYADFEGTIPPKQYGAGTVEIWDRGQWQPEGDPRAGYRAGKLKFHLQGQKLHGGWALVRTRLPASGDKEQWLLIKERDQEARDAAEFDVTAPNDAVAPQAAKVNPRAASNPKAPRVKSSKSWRAPDTSPEPIGVKGPLLKTLKPQVATLVQSLPATKIGKTAKQSGAAKSKGPNADDDVAGVKITHPERVIEKSHGFTKLDLARYYDVVHPWILPHLRARPIALLRGPDGIEGELFFQKHLQHLTIPDVKILDTKFDPGHAPLMVIESNSALVGAVQMGTIEFHTWNATVRSIERPDRMILDLDPDPALRWATMVEAARLTKALLEELGLRSFVKTSGGKGLHLVVPLARRHTWDDVTAFAQALAGHLAATIPDRFSAKMGAQNRIKKVFVDYLRNGRGASTVAAYSVRARKGLPVSVPVAWEELAAIHGADEWNILTIQQRLAELKRDPWTDYAKCSQILTAKMKEMLGL